MFSEGSFLQAIESLERDLQLPEKFLTRLTDEEDCSFVIKTHAPVEVSLSRLLAAAVQADQLGAVRDKSWAWRSRICRTSNNGRSRDFRARKHLTPLVID
jgi:hypothetical protein